MNPRESTAYEYETVEPGVKNPVHEYEVVDYEQQPYNNNANSNVAVHLCPAYNNAHVEKS